MAITSSILLEMT